MLGAEHVYADGMVEVLDQDDKRHERFWHMRGGQWRVERDDGLTFISDEAVGSIRRLPDGTTETGPALGPGFFLADTLLRPRFAYIWGRPGEDWRLTDSITELGDRRLRIELAAVENRLDSAHAVIDPETGIIHELVIGTRRLTLLGFNDLLASGMHVQDLFSLSL
jgi:hypothetical protein